MEMRERGLSMKFRRLKSRKTYAKVSFNSLYNPRIYKDIGLEKPHPFSQRGGRKRSAPAAGG